MHRYRIAVLLGLSFLFALLLITSGVLFGQLRELQESEGENMQWSISQLDTEFASLDAAVSKQLGAVDPIEDAVILRLDIVLSRIAILASGRANELLATSDQALQLLKRIAEFRERAIKIADGPRELTREDYQNLSELVTEARPIARQIALLGLRIQAAGSQQLRNDFARQLLLTGGTAIALILSMGGALLLLNKLLNQSVQRDAALSASSRRLASTVSASLDAIVATNSDGIIVDFNDAAEVMFGWAQADIVGASIDGTIIPPFAGVSSSRPLEHLSPANLSKIVDRGRHEMTAIRKDGLEFPAELNITSTPEEVGVRYIAYIRDISARKVNEQKLIDARDRAERTDRAKSRFLAIMSHEMRTPLNGMLGVLDLLKTTKLSGEQIRYADIAVASSEMLLEQVNEALDVTRAETGDLVLTLQDFDLDDLIRNVADVLKPLASEKGLRITCSANRVDGMRFVGDGNRVRQILTNLVGNAVKFTETGEINIFVRGTHGPDDSAIQIDVVDTGPGIEEEHLEDIFEDYVAIARADGRQTRGDGLGLSISRRIAQKMGGNLTVESQPGQGTKFTLQLPLPRAEAKSEPANAVVGWSKPTIANQRQLDILVVEDHGINRNVLSEMLGGMGHNVSEAVDGLEAADLAEQSRFDVIFMDISMPRMDGIAATRRIRKSLGPNAKTPIIGLTAHGKDEYQAKSLEAGMTAFQTKPVRLSILRDIVENLDRQGSILELQNRKSDALLELEAALGAQKFEHAISQFFDEFAEFLAFVGDGVTTGSGYRISGWAHKMKGAAAMFGFAELEAALQDFDGTANFETENAMADQLNRLERLGAEAMRKVEERPHALPAPHP